MTSRLLLPTLTVLAMAAVPATSQTDPCAAPPVGRREAITHLRLVNTLQAASASSARRYLSRAEINAQIAESAIPSLPAGGRLEVFADESGYMAVVTLAGTCPRSFTTGKDGLIFEGTPLR